MGIMVTKNDENTKLTEKINSDLRTKLASTSKPEDKDLELNFAETSEYLKETERAGKFSWVWIVLVVLAIISLVLIVLI